LLRHDRDRNSCPGRDRTAAAGDARANALLSLAAEELVVHVRALALRLFGDERASIPVAFSGGLLQKGSLLGRSSSSERDQPYRVLRSSLLR
jgi:hypothetical protein